MNLSTTLDALRRGWYLLLIGAVLSAAAAVAINGSAAPYYEAKASFVVGPAALGSDLARGVDTLDASRSRSIMTTLTEIADSEVVITEAFASLGLSPDLAAAYTVDSVIVPEANVMETIVVGPDPETAALLASEIGKLGGVRFEQLYQIYDVGILDAATIPTEPSNPGLPQMLVIAVALGMMAGGAAALMRAAFMDRAGRTMDRRLGAYGAAVTPIQEHSRFKRAG